MPSSIRPIGESCLGGSFSKQEFLVMLKKIVRDVDLWDSELRDVCHLAHKEVSGGDSRIDVVEETSRLPKSSVLSMRVLTLTRLSLNASS